MQLASYRDNQGFTVFELIIAMGMATVVLGGALVLTSQAIGIGDMVSQRSEMQQNGRVAINMMARDASQAGTGFPVSGVQLPSGKGSEDSFLACDAAGCYVTNNVYTDERLYATWPGDSGGPTINGVATDVLTLVYEDPTSTFDQFVLEDIADEKAEFNTATTPAYDDAVVGLRENDTLLFNNANGVAVATVTKVKGKGEIEFKKGGKGENPLNLNQKGADFGNVDSILGAPTTAKRIHIITYYIDDSDPDIPLLMRQVNGHPPMPVAEYVENLQVTYDIYDENAAVAQADLTDAGGVPNQIRKTNITLTVRSPGQNLIERDFERITLTTSVGPRNLTYRDRYE